MEKTINNYLKQSELTSILSTQTQKEIKLFFANSNLDKSQKENLIEIFKHIYLDSKK